MLGSKATRRSPWSIQPKQHPPEGQNLACNAEANFYFACQNNGYGAVPSSFSSIACWPGQRRRASSLFSFLLLVSFAGRGDGGRARQQVPAFARQVCLFACLGQQQSSTIRPPGQPLRPSQVIDVDCTVDMFHGHGRCLGVGFKLQGLAAHTQSSC